MEKAADDTLPVDWLAERLSCGPADLRAERFCDSDGDYQRKYNVYKISAGGQSYVCKQADAGERDIYENFLQGKAFAVPEYYGNVVSGKTVWLLTEYIEGPDLRRFTREMALASADTLAEIQNFYWDCKAQDGRFDRYWERICRRARCLEKEPELAAAYDIFLERQKSCPRTLSNGDFLQFNGIWRDGRVSVIDWGFGGIMPYALDITRLIAHGTLVYEPDGFPFYMDDDLRGTFVQACYKALKQKPDWDRYLMDIRLAALNEYVEFLEEELNDPEANREEIAEGSYYKRAKKTAEEILRMEKRNS